MGLHTIYSIYLLRLYSMITNTLLCVYSNFTQGVLFLFCGFESLFWVYSHLTSGFSCSILQVFTLCPRITLTLTPGILQSGFSLTFLLVLLTHCTRFTNTLHLVLSHFTLSLLLLYSGFTKALLLFLLSPFCYLYLHFTQDFTHPLLKVCSHFYCGLLCLFSESYTSLQFHSQFTLCLLTLNLTFTQTSLKVQSHSSPGVLTFYCGFAHT